VHTTPTPRTSDHRLPRGRAAIVIGGLVLTLAACGGAAASSSATKATSPATSAPASSGAAGTAGVAAPAGTASTAGRTAGTVKSIAGDQLVITDRNGNDVNVAATATTAVSLASSGTLANFKVGDAVSVQGAADASGNITATAVRSVTGTARPNAGSAPAPSAAGGAAARTGGGTFGTVTAVNGDQLVLATSQGGRVTVTTSSTTAFTVTTKGALSDLKVGTSVTVQGQPDANGTITATAISTGFGGARGGQPPQATTPTTVAG
jgi:flagellin